ncbi:hypothetical protein NW761_009700 [Fusarium oxysporum]|nr:hypothetical protein NW758_007150 [Fusarium oxysporum]KAJ4052588.1 hypothetical protein NW763_008749 [Fusarium oxysporum]KAJ4083923.1 hypothetical protein NW761_009700 [Fusarium oxysporum]KAJ4219695.1 hypothetical protein NW760_012325 [Fusarium oxysporum]
MKDTADPWTAKQFLASKLSSLRTLFLTRWHFTSFTTDTCSILDALLYILFGIAPRFSGLCRTLSSLAAGSLPCVRSRCTYFFPYFFLSCRMITFWVSSPRW